MAYDIPSISDLEAIQLLNKHYAEVVTSKKDGIASGSDITQTTNPITGVVRRTLYKILDDMDVEHDAQMQSFENDFDSRLAGMAFTRVGTFTAGATLTDMRQTLLWEVSQGGGGHEYGWTGSFPKVVPAGSTPATSGGIGAGAWVDRTDVTLRDKLALDNGAGMVGTSDGRTVQERFDNIPAKVDAAGTAAALISQHNSSHAAHPELSAFVDRALSDLSTAANKFYPTLAEANADIANINVNQPVTVGEAVNGGLWYKATVGATTLTKSAYDPLTQAKVDAATALHVNTDTTQPNEVLIADSRGNSALAYDPISKKLIGNFETKAKYLAKLINHFLFYGQSLSVGAEGLPVISTVALYTNKTFVGGPRGANNFASLKPLIEDNTTAPDGLNNRGETPCSGAANAASLFAWKENGINPDDFSIFCSTAGKGGTRIDLLDKGEDWYNNQFLSHIWNGYKLSGDNYGLPCVAWLQGESDLDAETPITYAEYKSKLAQLREDTQNYVFSMCGQRYPITFLTYQLSYKIKTSDAVARSQFDLDKENENFGLVVPTYMFPHHGDQVHLTNVGYKWIGAYFGRAFKQVVFDGIKPKGIRPISAYKDGLMIKVKLKAPQLPLKFDTTTLKATTNQGFSVHDDTGVVSVASVAVVDDTVTITLSAETTGSVTVKYAYEYAATGLGINGGASGNLIDSTTDSVVINSVEKPMFYVCPHFSMPVKKLEI